MFEDGASDFNPDGVICLQEGWMLLSSHLNSDCHWGVRGGDAQMLISLVLMILDYSLMVCSYILGIYQDFMISSFIIDVFQFFVLIFQLPCHFFKWEN